MKSHQWLRRIFQFGFLVGLIFLFLWQDFSHVDPPWFSKAGWMDPLFGLGSFSAGNITPIIILSIVGLGLAVFFSRFFCGWICPIGAFLDLMALGKKAVHWPDRSFNEKTMRILDFLRWGVFGCVIGLIVAGYPAALLFNPLVLMPREIFRLLNASIPWSFAFLVLVGLLLFPRFWCRFLCPAGSFLSLCGRPLGKKYRVTADCKQCGRCVRNCSMKNVAFNNNESKDSSAIRYGFDCMNCSECEKSCPIHCIVKNKKPKDELNEGRRDFITAAGFGLGTLALGLINRSAVLPADTKPRLWSRLLRPPGALAEQRFNATCTRCGQCLQVCPTKVLVPSGLEAGIEGLWTPRFVPCRGPVPGRCMFCMACVQVCPTGALDQVPPETVRLGRAEINRSQCLAWAKGTQCLLCVETCPKFAITIDKTGKHPVIDAEKCNGCGSCEAHCPVEGSAVLLTNVGETRRTP